MHAVCNDFLNVRPYGSYLSARLVREPLNYKPGKSAQYLILSYPDPHQLLLSFGPPEAAPRALRLDSVPSMFNRSGACLAVIFPSKRRAEIQRIPNIEPRWRAASLTPCRVTHQTEHRVRLLVCTQLYRHVFGSVDVPTPPWRFPTRDPCETNWMFPTNPICPSVQDAASTRPAAPHHQVPRQRRPHGILQWDTK